MSKMSLPSSNPSVFGELSPRRKRVYIRSKAEKAEECDKKAPGGRGPIPGSHPEAGESKAQRTTRKADFPKGRSHTRRMRPDARRNRQRQIVDPRAPGGRGPRQQGWCPLKNLKANGWVIFSILTYPIILFVLRKERKREKARTGAYDALVRAGMCAKVEPEDIPKIGAYADDFPEVHRAGRQD